MLKISVADKKKSVLTVSPGFQINFPEKKPNWWWRMWQYLFFGFRWKSITPPD